MSHPPAMCQCGACAACAQMFIRPPPPKTDVRTHIQIQGELEGGVCAQYGTYLVTGTVVETSISLSAEGQYRSTYRSTYLLLVVLLLVIMLLVIVLYWIVGYTGGTLSVEVWNVFVFSQSKWEQHWCKQFSFG
ncbi:hypothetical protein BZA05DRAFT_434032 [Tricharina praecox]|uniref:uncharacterized protein n=1 Tax=Tricharina praecox TaxID=43433 RepID=UPI0022209F4C|nr:uncharacterized protein BZA05DRAFT_434032 [Tricharina praecox]KAI5856463.1 hypothetical protein BZA05DRAFT_434032 [Tricharina praecox]